MVAMPSILALSIIVSHYLALVSLKSCLNASYKSCDDSSFLSWESCAMNEANVRSESCCSIRYMAIWSFSCCVYSGLKMKL